MGTLNDAVDSTRDDGWDDLDLSYQTVAPNRWTFESTKIRRWVEQRLAAAVARLDELEADG